MLNLKVIRGNTFEQMPFGLFKNNVPIDLTGAKIKMQLRKECNGVVYLELDQDNGITIKDAVNGKFQIDEQIINIAPCNYKYDIRITFGDGTVKTWIKGDFLVICNITQ